jgi:pSer/pThr/pTyr-binding forkhead associated (FHA) protein
MEPNRGYIIMMLDEKSPTPDSSTEDESTQLNPPVQQTGRLDGGIQDTFILGKNRSLRAMLDKRPPRTVDRSLPQQEVTLLFRGIPEHLTITEDLSVIIGRADLKMRGFQPDVDLSPYGAHTRGVSRVHARLFLENKRLFIADLYSTNGTYIAGKRLEPNDPYRLHNGVEVLLGSLMMQVVFE